MSLSTTLWPFQHTDKTTLHEHSQVNPPSSARVEEKSHNNSQAHRADCRCHLFWGENPAESAPAPLWIMHSRKAPLPRNLTLPFTSFRVPIVVCVVLLLSVLFFCNYFPLIFVCPDKTLRTSHGHFHLFKDDQAGRKAGSGWDFVLVLPLSESRLTEVAALLWPSQRGHWQLKLANLSPRNPVCP